MQVRARVYVAAAVDENTVSVYGLVLIRFLPCALLVRIGQELRTFGPDQVDPFGKRRHNAVGLCVGTRVSRGNQDAKQDVGSGEHRRGFQAPKEKGQPGIILNHQPCVPYIVLEAVAMAAFRLSQDGARVFLSD